MPRILLKQSFPLKGFSCSGMIFYYISNPICSLGGDVLLTGIKGLVITEKRDYPYITVKQKD